MWIVPTEVAVGPVKLSNFTRNGVSPSEPATSQPTSFGASGFDPGTSQRSLNALRLPSPRHASGR